MKSFVARYIPEKNWFIEEKEWDEGMQAVRESQLTLGNGFVGSRGILEELPYGARAGTYIAGLYDARGSKVPELVNLPNLVNFGITAEEEKIGIKAMRVGQHKRYLNLRTGVLLRHTLFQDTKGRRFDYQSIRFFSMDDKNTQAMRIFLTPLDANCDITVQTGIDTSITNVGGITEGRKRHFRITRVFTQKHLEFMSVRTFENKIAVCYATALRIELGKKAWYCREHPFQLNLRKNQTVCFTKLSYLNKFEDKESDNNIEKASTKALERSIKLGFNELYNRHCASWKKIWQGADIVIKGDEEAQRGLRFNMYHLLICAPRDAGKSSIAARTLSGEGYRGHIFWDAEIFILPFFLFTEPAVARNMLLYRYKRLGEARRLAKKRGFKGAMFPWESAGVGDEVTPPWAKNLDGSIIRIHTHEMEQHITADIAYAVYRYYEVTNDADFMVRYGFEILFETARFWVSRLEHNKKTDKYELKHVIGPDEFHEKVNNNAYTNWLVRRILFIACGMFLKMKKKYPYVLKLLSDKINLQQSEVKKWKRVIPKIYFSNNKGNLIEQFSGFFKRKEVKIKKLDENFMPVFPERIALKDVGKTQLVKQADVVLLLYLFCDNFDLKTKKENYYYYAPRTVHKSSLSPAIYSIVAVPHEHFSIMSGFRHRNRREIRGIPLFLYIDEFGHQKSPP